MHAYCETYCKRLLYIKHVILSYLVKDCVPAVNSSLVRLFNFRSMKWLGNQVRLYCSSILHGLGYCLSDIFGTPCHCTSTSSTTNKFVSPRSIVHGSMFHCLESWCTQLQSIAKVPRDVATLTHQALFHLHYSMSRQLVLPSFYWSVSLPTRRFPLASTRRRMTQFQEFPNLL